MLTKRILRLVRARQRTFIMTLMSPPTISLSLLGILPQSGLEATYYTDNEWGGEAWEVVEGPVLEYEHYPPSGLDSQQLPSSAFSVRWGGYLHSLVDAQAVLSAMAPVETLLSMSMMFFIQKPPVCQEYPQRYQFWEFYEQNSTMVPTGSAEFTFKRGATIKIRIEYQGLTTVSGQRLVAPTWNLVDRKNELEKAFDAGLKGIYGDGATINSGDNPTSSFCDAPVGVVTLDCYN